MLTTTFAIQITEKKNEAIYSRIYRRAANMVDCRLGEHRQPLRWASMLDRAGTAMIFLWETCADSCESAICGFLVGGITLILRVI